MSLAIDTIIAEKAMGWTAGDHPEKAGTTAWFSEYGEPVYFAADGSFRCANSFQPSEEIEDAWEAIEKMGERNYMITLQCFGNVCTVYVDQDNPIAFELVKKHGFRHMPIRMVAMEYGETMPEAICKAIVTAIETVESRNQREP